MIYWHQNHWKSSSHPTAQQKPINHPSSAKITAHHPGIQEHRSATAPAHRYWYLRCKWNRHTSSITKLFSPFYYPFSGALYNGDAGELLEYHHLIKRPKYKDNWGDSSGNEVGRLCQKMTDRNDGTNKMFLMRSSGIDERMSLMVNCFAMCDRKKMKSIAQD